MPTITVRFVTSGSFVSRGIRFVTNSLWSHVEIGTDKGWIGAHISGGIQERPLDYCTPTKQAVYEIPCTLRQQKLMLAWTRAKIGTAYNTKDILGLMLHNRSLNSPRRYICSQFVTEALIFVFGADKVLNVLSEEKYLALITPETLHLSPIFVGRRKP